MSSIDTDLNEELLLDSQLMSGFSEILSLKHNLVKLIRGELFEVNLLCRKQRSVRSSSFSESNFFRSLTSSCKRAFCLYSRSNSLCFLNSSLALEKQVVSDY